MPAKMKSRPVKLLFLNAGHKKLSVNKFYSVPPLKGTLKARKKYGVFGAKIATAGHTYPIPSVYAMVSHGTKENGY